MWRYVLPILLAATPIWAEEKTFNFNGIDSIDARNGVTVTVVEGDEVSIVANARKGDVDKLSVRKFGPWLAINRDTRWFIFPFGRSDDLEVTVTLPNLRNIKAYDTALATASGFSGDTLRAEALEGGTVDLLDVDVVDVTLYATEGGSLTVAGACQTVVAEAIINAEIAAGDLACANAAALTRGGGSITAAATTLASQDDSLGGTIEILGTPEIVDYLPGMEPEEEAVAADG